MKSLFHISLTLAFLACFDASAITAGWTQRASFGSNGRHRGCGISIGNKGYMGLGHYNGAGPNIVLADWWEYDPASNSWTQKANYIGNGGNGNYGVLALGMAQYGYVGGGQLASSTAFYRYDPISNSWATVAAMPTVFSNAQGFVIGTKGYYVGSGGQFFEYDAVLDVWTTKNLAPFSVAIWNSAFTIDGKGYIKSANSLWEYKPTTDQWAPRANFPGLSTAGSVSFSQNGKGYVVCGYGSWLSDVNSGVWEFDPATNQWLPLPEFPGTSRRFAAGFSIGNRSYFGIGTNGTNFNDFWEFNGALAFASIDDLVDLSNFSAYPNPAIDAIHFRSESLNGFEIKVFDLTGRELGSVTTTGNTCAFSRNNIPSGCYYYQVISGKTIKHQERFIFN